MHAQRDPGGADGHDDQGEQGDHGLAPAGRHGGQEDQQAPGLLRQGPAGVLLQVADEDTGALRGQRTSG